MKHKQHKPHGGFHQRVKSICKSEGCSDVAKIDGYCKNCYQFHKS